MDENNELKGRFNEVKETQRLEFTIKSISTIRLVDERLKVEELVAESRVNPREVCNQASE